MFWKKFVLKPTINFIANRIKAPRFWVNEEWFSHTNEEKLWIFWKNFWYIKGVGSGEIDQFTMPIKDMLMFGGIILTTVSSALIYMKIELEYTFILSVVVVGCIILYGINTIFQWWLGNKLDARDLPSLSARVTEKRSRVFRKIMNEKMQEKWRTGKRTKTNKNIKHCK